MHLPSSSMESIPLQPASQLSRRPKELLASHQLQPLETQEEKNVQSEKVKKKKKVGILWYLSAIEKSIQETTTRFNPIEWTPKQPLSRCSCADILEQNGRSWKSSMKDRKLLSSLSFPSFAPDCIPKWFVHHFLGGWLKVPPACTACRRPPSTSSFILVKWMSF